MKRVHRQLPGISEAISGLDKITHIQTRMLRTKRRRINVAVKIIVAQCSKQEKNGTIEGSANRICISLNTRHTEKCSE
jgi:hypothetical protein